MPLKPDQAVVKGGLPPNGRARVLSESGKQFAVYLFGGPQANLVLALPAGRYRVEWVDPLSGKVMKSDVVDAAGPKSELNSPKFDTDIALRVLRAE